MWVKIYLIYFLLITNMSKKTVFIIGAGASKEAKLPTGAELKSTISNLLNMKFDFGRLKSGDHKIVAALRLHVSQSDNNRGDINPHLHEAWHIKDALPQAMSIDAFIDSQRNNEKIALCGKLGIVRSILEAEKNSLLYYENKSVNSNIDFDALSDTWYIPFFQLLTESCTKDDLKSRFQLITLIIFNYDRCVEHFIYHALQSYYRLSNIEAADLVNSINIYHPYGTVGTLPWMQSGTVEFGIDPQPSMLLKLTNKIKTFTEGTNPDSSEILAIRKSMGTVNRLIFLGFAFHKLNLELISPSDFKKNLNKVDCFATALGISNSDRKVVVGQISDLYGGSVEVRTTDSQCGPFFKEYWRSLGF